MVETRHLERARCGLDASSAYRGIRHRRLAGAAEFPETLQIAAICPDFSPKPAPRGPLDLPPAIFVLAFRGEEWFLLEPEPRVGERRNSKWQSQKRNRQRN